MSKYKQSIKHQNILTIFTAMLIAIIPIFAGELLKAQGTDIPNWASDQLVLRELVKQQITETMSWQNQDGVIFPSLSQWKWDDEVEIFYYWMIYYQLTGDESVYESVKSAANAFLQRRNIYLSMAIIESRISIPNTHWKD